MPTAFSSFCSSPPQTAPNSRLLTGIRSNPCATPHGRSLFGHLAERPPPTGYEPKSCIDVCSEHTPINYSSMRNSFNIEKDLTTTVAASENFDGFHQQAAASGSPQLVPASEVNPWLSADMWSRTRNLVRGNASIASVEGALSRGKRDRDMESVQTLSEGKIYVSTWSKKLNWLFQENAQPTLTPDLKRWWSDTWNRKHREKHFSSRGHFGSSSSHFVPFAPISISVLAIFLCVVLCCGSHRCNFCGNFLL